MNIHSQGDQVCNFAAMQDSEKSVSSLSEGEKTKRDAVTEVYSSLAKPS